MKNERLVKGKEKVNATRGTIESNAQTVFEHYNFGNSSPLADKLDQFRQIISESSLTSETHFAIDTKYLPKPVASTKKFDVYRLTDCDIMVVDVVVGDKSKRPSVSVNPRVRFLLDTEGKPTIVPYTDERWSIWQRMCALTDRCVASYYLTRTTSTQPTSVPCSGSTTERR